MARRAYAEAQTTARSVTFTFDTGMLIALERRRSEAWQAFRAIVRRGYLPVVPAVVLVEWWRGRSDTREQILDAVSLEGMGPALCRSAGEALSAIRGVTLADAVVMASASLRGGGVVYTGDVDDLTRLTRHFPTVRVLPI